MWIFAEKAYQFRLCILRHKICGDAERWQWQWWPCTRACRSGIGYWWNMFISEYSHSNDVQMKFAYGIGVCVCMWCQFTFILGLRLFETLHKILFTMQANRGCTGERGRKNKKRSTATFKKMKMAKALGGFDAVVYLWFFFSFAQLFFFSLILSFHTVRFDI